MYELQFVCRILDHWSGAEQELLDQSRSSYFLKAAICFFAFVTKVGLSFSIVSSKYNVYSGISSELRLQMNSNSRMLAFLTAGLL
jgi:hypothetical protein